MTEGFSRERALEQMGSRAFDVLVVGGGITGAGVALDAASRGLAVALVERADLASGTSSKSSKLVHGGLRYLQQRDYLLVREGLVERQRLLANAPHLVQPLAFLVPIFGRDGVVNRTVAKFYSSALWTYDIVGGLKRSMRHRRIDRTEAARLMPTLRADRLAAGFIYWDARTDDARLTLTVARTAALDFGAAVANYAPVAGLLRDQNGRIAGARLGASPVGGPDTDGLEVRAGVVVNASGVWSDDVRQLGEGRHPDSIRPAKGVHITLAAEKLPTEVATVLPVPGDRRSIFVVPWGDRVYVGTTDTDYHGPLDDPQCSAEDISYLVAAVNAFVSAPISDSDVLGTWAGLRPLVKAAATERTADLSRRHAVSTSPDGLVTVTGGKLTTYRRMAADTVDAALEVLGPRRRGRSRRSSRTRNLRLHGAPPEGRRTTAPSGPTVPSGPAVPSGPSAPATGAVHLTGRFGTEAEAVAALAREDAGLGEPLVEGLPYLRAEAVWAAREEMACTLEDVLSRRTRALLLDREAAARAAPATADLLGTELGWTAERRAGEVEAFLRLVESERQANRSPADAART